MDPKRGHLQAMSAKFRKITSGSGKLGEGAMEEYNMNKWSRVFSIMKRGGGSKN